MIDHARALALPIEHEPVPAGQLVSGSPTTGLRRLGSLGGSDYGVWEMTPGAMSDVEDDEVFVVIAGRATIAFPATGETIDLVPGVIARLDAGTRTIWTVTETLRKVWFG